MIYFCCEPGRQSLVLAHPVLNAIESLEVVHHEEPILAQQQRRLRVFFLKPPIDELAERFEGDPLASAALVKIFADPSAVPVTVDAVQLIDDHLEVSVTPRGDDSRYTLHLVEPDTDSPLQQLDPRLSRIDFSFKVECESELDCRPVCSCSPQIAAAPEIDYLAKDYASFRQLMLEHLMRLCPSWQPRTAADLGVTLVEVLAYLGDYLSYRQDAIATEAYLGTARRRVSVRRHTRLLDYPMHEGCNARAWVQVRVAPGGPPLKLTASGPSTSRLRFVTRVRLTALLTEQEYQTVASAAGVEVFEAMEDVELFPEHNELFFHTWGDALCCLPRGATRATLRGHFPDLRPGQVLIFAERLGPWTGNPVDADPNHRHAVRLTHVEALQDEAFIPAVDVTDIRWSAADALPLPFCLSARAQSDGRLLSDVSVAWGNLVLADHGRTLPQPETLGPVPALSPALAPVAASDCGHCVPAPRFSPAVRFRPSLQFGPLTQTASYDPGRPAAEALRWDMKAVLPAVQMTDNLGQHWTPKRHLLASDAFATEFVVEVENDGRAAIRFGDDENGMRPAEQSRFLAIYRTGNGTRGNLGTGALAHLVSDGIPASAIESVSNPLPARGGIDPEPLEVVRQNAPAAFRVQQRAVTPEDYATKAAEHPDVQRAAATLRWTGSWHTVFLSVDRRGGRRVDAAFRSELTDHLQRYRLAGQDLQITGPRLVPLELEIRVCVVAEYFRSDVITALNRAFDNRQHTDGSRGFFHPDQFSFGQPVVLSRIYAQAQRIAGVAHVEVLLLRRQGANADPPVPTEGSLDLGPMEIAQLDNDPNDPGRGVLRLQAVGGR